MPFAAACDATSHPGSPGRPFPRCRPVPGRRRRHTRRSGASRRPCRSGSRRRPRRLSAARPSELQLGTPLASSNRPMPGSDDQESSCHRPRWWRNRVADFMISCSPSLGIRRLFPTAPAPGPWPLTISHRTTPAASDRQDRPALKATGPGLTHASSHGPRSHPPRRRVSLTTSRRRGQCEPCPKRTRRVFPHPRTTLRHDAGTWSSRQASCIRSNAESRGHGIANLETTRAHRGPGSGGVVYTVRRSPRSAPAVVSGIRPRSRPAVGWCGLGRV